MGATFLQTAVDTTDASSYSFTAQNLGTAAGDRLIICAVHSRSTGTGARNVTALTIGGVTATLVIARTTSATDLSLVEIWIAPVPTGTTGTVAVTFNNTMLRCGIALIRAVDTSIVPGGTGGTSTDNTGFTVHCRDQAFIVAAATSGASTTCTWNLSESYDTTMEANTTLTGVLHGTFSPEQDVNTQGDFVTATEPVFVGASFNVPGRGGLLTLGCGA